MSNGEELSCSICGGVLKYRDKVPRIAKRYNGDVLHGLIERWKCQDPACGKVHRCLPKQLVRFKHFITEIIEDTVDDVAVPENPDDSDRYYFESPSPRTIAGWKDWIRHNTPYIDGYLKAAGHSILGLSTQFLKSGVSLLKELRKEGGWLSTIQTIIYNSGGSLEPCYPARARGQCTDFGSMSAGP